MKILLSLIFLVLFSQCNKTTLDSKYIRSKEWLSKSGNIIRFDSNSEILKNDTIFQENIPIAVVLKLNKENHQMLIFSFTKKCSIEYTDTEMFTK